MKAIATDDRNLNLRGFLKVADPFEKAERFILSSQKFDVIYDGKFNEFPDDLKEKYGDNEIVFVEHNKDEDDGAYYINVKLLDRKGEDVVTLEKAMQLNDNMFYFNYPQDIKAEANNPNTPSGRSKLAKKALKDIDKRYKRSNIYKIHFMKYNEEDRPVVAVEPNFIVLRLNEYITGKEFNCCICGRPSLGYGNNPDPVRTEGRCCDSCNDQYVIPARMGMKIDI